MALWLSCLHTHTHISTIFLYIKTRLVLVHVPTEQRPAGCPEPFEAMMMPQKTDLPESYKGLEWGFTRCWKVEQKVMRHDACFQ